VLKPKELTRTGSALRTHDKFFMGFRGPQALNDT